VSLISDESEEAFRELWDVLPSEIRFNGLVRPCVSHTVKESKQMEIAGYNFRLISQVEILSSDLAEFSNIEERVSKMNVREASGDFDDDRPNTGDWGEDFVFVQKDSHADSATVTLYLAARMAN
jgi:hypothetical protein